MPEYLEENRYLYIRSKLGPNELLLESFTGTEGISQLFSFQLELLSENAHIRFEDILGQELSFGVLGPEGSGPRHIHGIVTAFTQLPSTPRLARYRASVAPKAWILTRKHNCRIFQNLAVPDILRAVLKDFNVCWELRGQYSPREYCVQYRETDFNFISRLMEEEGIFYFFRFNEDSDEMVVGDTPASHADMPGDSSLTYEEIAGGERDEVRITNWVKTQELGPGKYSLQDYCYGTPQADMLVDQQILDSTQVGKVTHKLKVAGNDQFEIYDYPGGYGMRKQAGDSQAKTAGSAMAKVAMEHLEMAQFVIRADSNDFNLIPGYRFTLERHPNADGGYVLTSITHSASEGGFHSGGDIGENHYSNVFHSIPVALPFRPPRTAAKAQVHGCQTAVVVGPAGEEIFCDQSGRVKVQFHWDREGKKDASSSCWIRFANFWAGMNWGAVHIPRIGQEVIVDFLEGDPDRPIIVGSVYNGRNMPPWSLPANKTQSGIISRSSKGGSGDNCNQIRFEDLKGSEQVLVHAEKNLDTEVENDETRQVGHDRKTTVGHDETADISNKRTTTVGSDDSTTIGGKMDLMVTSDRTATVGGNDSETIGGSRTVTIMAGDTLTVSGPVKINSSAEVTITAPMVTINAAMLMASGVVKCATLITQSVVSPTYTPGAGNIY